jgi:hypothetical protein
LFQNIFLRCQDVFLDEVELGPNIARNQALKENVFMMIVCIELRIPLFLVGKPGSSKSLAKTVVAEAMQGDSSASELFRTLKSVCNQCSCLVIHKRYSPGQICFALTTVAFYGCLTASTYMNVLHNQLTNGQCIKIVCL